MIINNTGLKILKLFLSDPAKEYNIREISIRTQTNYRLVYQEVMSFMKNQILFVNKKGLMNLCKINLAKDMSLYNYVESLRSEEFQEKNRNFKVIVKELSKLSTTYYILIVFGSYVKGGEKKHSDIDLLFVIPNNISIESFEKEVLNILKLLSYKIDINVINENNFLEMRQNSELNIVNEIIKNHIILFGAENYYNLLIK